MRACLTLLLVTGHLITQVAALHVHADDWDDEHAAVPHVHLSWLGDAPTAHLASELHHETDAIGTVAIESSDQSSHDSDAVYVATSAVASAALSHCRALAFSHWELQAVALLSDARGNSVWTDTSAVCHRSCGDVTVCHCALFLQLQTLRI